jgi:hypothetical protein
MKKNSARLIALILAALFILSAAIAVIAIIVQ